eukprot:gene40964-54246_t
MKSSGGRNSEGKMTMRYTGGGHKQRYRIIDFKRTKDGIPASVKSIEYDPNRTAFIALLAYADGEKTYVIAQNGLQVGQKLVSGADAQPEIGQGAVIARSAGTFAQLMARDGKYATIKMPSGETRLILLTCSATIGAVSNSDHQLIVSGKAGRSSGGHPRSRKGIPAKGYRTRSKQNPSNKYIVERRKK